MHEHDWVEHFNRDVDQELDEAGRAEPQVTSAEYRELLALARTLAETDLSAESSVRQSLRRWLLDGGGAREGWALKKAPHLNTFPRYSLRCRLLWAMGGALVLLLAIMFLVPGGPVAAADRIRLSAKLIILGAYSRAQQVEAIATGKPLPDDGWHVVLFPGFGVGGNGLPGTNPTVLSGADFDSARGLVTFDIRTPSYLPEGYALREIKLAPVWTGLGARLFPSNPSAFLFYGGPGSDIVIVQQPVGPQPSRDPNVAVGTVTSFMTNGTLEEVELNGHTAAWADGRLLLWEEAGMSYTVGGPDLALETALRIAEALTN